MKKLITILAALFLSANTSVQAQDCLWAKSAGGSASDEGTSTCTDASGNVYVVGDFESPTITFGTTTLTNTGSSFYDIFIAKYDASGNLLWAKSAGGTSSDNVKSVTTDASGNIYITGYFISPIITFGTTTLINADNSGSSDFFIAKYDAAGNVLWAKSAGATSSDLGQSISTDASGNVYVTGTFRSPTITFGSTTLTNTDSYLDIFIVKYDAAGTVLWGNSAGGTADDRVNSVATDASGNVYVTGYFKSATITFGTTTFTNAGFSDIFIVKYDAAGNVLWAKSAVGTSGDFGQSVSTDASGNVYVTGYFISPTITFGTTTITNAGFSDIFIVKYNAAGTVLWAKSAGGASYDRGNSVATDASGNVYMTGEFRSPNFTFGSTTLTNAGELDIFIVKYAHNGTELWATSAGGTGDDKGQSVSTDANGSIYVTGTFYSPSITFGTTTIANADTSGNTGDIFIAKYSGVSNSLNETLSNNQLYISPNPTNSSITLTMPFIKNSNVCITNLTGTEVGNYNTQNSNTQTIDISHLANGVYFVSLKSEEGVVTKKIIKQ